MEKMSLKGQNGKVYFGWWVTLAGFILIVFGYSCVVSVTGVFLLPVTEDLGFTIGEFSTYLMISGFSSIGSLLLFTKFMTERRIRTIMILAAVMGAAAFLGFSKADQLWQFYLLSVPMGFCFGCLTSTPCTILISNWFGTRTRGVALGLLFSPVGAMLASYILNIVVQQYSWRIGYFAIACGLLFICVPCILIFAVWGPEKMGLSRMGETEEDASMLLSSGEKIGISFREATKRPSTWLVFFSATLIVIGSGAVLQHMISYLVMNGFTANAAAAVFSLMFGGLAVASIIVGAYCDRFSLRSAAVATCIAFAVLFLAALFIPKAPWLVVVLILGYSFGCPAVNVVSPLLMSYMFGEKHLGKFISLSNVFIALGGAFGGALVGKIYDASGTYQTAWIIMIVLFLLSAVIRGVCTGDKYKCASRLAQTPSDAAHSGSATVRAECELEVH